MYKELRSQIGLLQGYYKFFYLGKFLEEIIKDNDMSVYALDIPLETGKNSLFVLRGDKIKKSLSEIYKYPNKKNVFGYITELSAFRGIFGVMRELLDNNIGFRWYVEKKLGLQFFPFEQVIRFSRNVLNHALDIKISLKEDDFLNQKLFLKEQKKYEIMFSFVYSKFFEEWKGKKDYGMKIKINFSKIKEGQSFFDIIKLHDLYLLSELCFNLAEVFKYCGVKK